MRSIIVLCMLGFVMCEYQNATATVEVTPDIILGCQTIDIGTANLPKGPETVAEMIEKILNNLGLIIVFFLCNKPRFIRWITAVLPYL